MYQKVVHQIKLPWWFR